MKRKQFMRAFAVAVALSMAVPTVTSNSLVLKVEAAYSTNDYEKKKAETDTLVQEFMASAEYAETLKEDAIANPAKAEENYATLLPEWDKLYAIIQDSYESVYKYASGMTGKAPNRPGSDKKAEHMYVDQPVLATEDVKLGLYEDYKLAKENYLANSSEENLEEISIILAKYALVKTEDLSYTGEFRHFYADGLLVVCAKFGAGNEERKGFKITGSDLDSLKLTMYCDLFTKDGTDYSYTVGEDYVHNMRTNATYPLTSRPEYKSATKAHVEFKDGLFKKSIDMKGYTSKYRPLVDMTVAEFEVDEVQLQNQVLYNQIVYNHDLAVSYFSTFHNAFAEVRTIRNEYNETAFPEANKSEVAAAKAACESNPTEDNFVALGKAMVKAMCYANKDIKVSTVQVLSVDKEFDTICVTYQMNTDKEGITTHVPPMTKFYRYSTDLNNLALREVQVQYASKDEKVQYVLGGTKVYANKGKNAHDIVDTTVNADQSITITYKEYLVTKKAVVYPVKENTFAFSCVDVYVRKHLFLSDCYNKEYMNDGRVLIFLNGTNTCTYLDENGRSASFSTSNSAQKTTDVNDTHSFSYKNGTTTYYLDAQTISHTSTPSVFTIEDALN